MSNSRNSTTDPRREFALDVVRQLRTAGFQSLWAGGCVRDQLLGKDPKDYDVATNALPKDVIRIFGEQRSVPVGVAFGVVMIPGPTRRHGQVEVATFRSDGEYLDGRHPESVQFCSSEEDAKRRDFTINGMFFDPMADAVLDYVGGQEDLRRRVIRAIGNPRGDLVKITCECFEPSGSPLPSASHSKHKLSPRFSSSAAASRVSASNGLCRSCGECSPIPPVPPHSNSCNSHSCFLKSCRNSSHGSKILCNSQKPAVPLNTLNPYDSNPRSRLLLRPLHNTAQSESRQRLQAIHAICRRLKMANEEIDCISWILESLPTLQHIATRPLHVLKPLLADARAPLLLSASSAADTAAERPANDASFAWHYLSRTPPDQINPPPLINGHDLRQLGVPMGPEIRRILTAVRNAQLDEHLPGRDAALEMASQLISSARTNPR
ncbi:MAG UNVERIFIED_CONTAM: hypothetical protein LVR18_37650 [Planctomycetaceae bacterium]|jgi:hypothetical protein